MTFQIRTGINISHWLSQVFGWSPIDTFFVKDDISFIRDCGFDHIRLPIDEERLWDEKGKQIHGAFEKMLWCIDESLAAGLKVIVDLHILRSHHFNNTNAEGAMTLWSDMDAQKTFLDLWSQLSAVLKTYPTDKVAYELMNEPVAPTHDEWNLLIAKAMKHVRSLEPNRVLFWGSNEWQFCENMPYLKLPENDKNIILSFHTYEPLMITHYRAGWLPIKDYTGPVSYPGTSLSEEDYEKYIDKKDEKLVNFIKRFNGYYDKEKLYNNMLPAINKSKELGLQLYCGEFGCLANIGRERRLLYYNDITSLFRENNIAFTAWDYKGDFGIRGWDRSAFKNTTIDKELIDILVK